MFQFNIKTLLVTVLLQCVVGCLLIGRTQATSSSLHMIDQQTLSSRGILQVQVVSRHCDRLPAQQAYIPNDPIDFPKISKIKWGGLTGLGQAQCNQMGNVLYNRYIDVNSPNRIRGISTQYVDTDYAFRSTDVDRTLMSMWSISMGLFKQGTGNAPLYNFNNPNDLAGGSLYALPNGTQAVPIHTVPDETDSVLIGYQLCNSVMKRMNNLDTSAFFEKHRPIIKDLFRVTGWDASLGDTSLQVLIDLLVVQKSHNLLSIQWVHDHWDEICAIRDGYFSLIYTYDVFQREGSSDFVNLIKYHFENSKVKYQHYSAHDTTIQALVASLNLTSDYPSLVKQPDYGSYIAMELHEMSDGTTAVRFVLGKRFDDSTFMPLTMSSLGCKNEFCPLDLFSKLVTQFSIVPGNSTWCQECNNIDKGHCASEFVSEYNEVLRKEILGLRDESLALKIITPILAITNVCTILVLILLLICCLKRKKMNPNQDTELYHGMK